MRHDGPVAIRYPRAEHMLQAKYPCAGFEPSRWESLEAGEDLALIATGPMVAEALKARRVLAGHGISAAVINASTIKPLDEGLIRRLSAAGTPYMVLEEQALAGGLGSAIGELCVQQGLTLPRHIFALPDAFIPHGSHDRLLKHLGMDGDSIAAAIAGLMERIA